LVFTQTLSSKSFKTRLRKKLDDLFACDHHGRMANVAGMTARWVLANFCGSSGWRFLCHLLMKGKPSSFFRFGKSGALSG